MEFNCTIIKPNHLYRASVKKDTHIYRVYKRKYVLIVPEKLTVINRDYADFIQSVVYIDIGGMFGQNANIYLTQDTFNFENPTVSDIFEMAHALNRRKNSYKYDFKTNTLIKR